MVLREAGRGRGRRPGLGPSAELRAGRPRPGSHIWAVSTAIRPGGGCRDGPGARRGPQQTAAGFELVSRRPDLVELSARRR